MTCILIILSVISIMSLQAQDYLINFAGSGASTTVTTVKVENLTQGTNLTMNGTDILHLDVTTGIELILDNIKDEISFYPNPMTDYTEMKFVLPETENTEIILYDLSGRKIAWAKNILSKGLQTYSIQGINRGIYIVKILSGRYSNYGKLISSCSQIGRAEIKYKNTSAIQYKDNETKGVNEEIIMQYSTGDLLKFTGISGIYSTVLTDVPLGSKTIDFSFIACTDADGNNYPVVRIGTTKGTGDDSSLAEDKGAMTFMGENLKVTKLNDNTAITLVIDNNGWSSMESPAFCWYLNSIAYKDVLGAYYNWYAVNSGKLCPTGWHVPTHGEFIYLSEILGGYEEAGGKLKETGTAHWKSPNVGARNTTGFTALPAGYRDSNGSFPAMGSYGMWWSSSPSYVSCTSGAWYMYLYYNDNTLMIPEKCLSTTGYSVRCLAD